MPNLMVEQPSSAIISEVGTDGILYEVRPLVWSLEKADFYYEIYKKFRILSDDYLVEKEQFGEFLLNSGAVWFEVWNMDKNQSEGLVSLTDFVTSLTTGQLLSVNYHVALWDSRFKVRVPLHKAFIRVIFSTFRPHRLQVEIPLFAGGTIRMAKRVGFVEEGVKRKAKRYRGEWYGVLHMSILEDEV
jgi:hypothetical protein